MRVLHLLNELRPSGAEEMLRIAGPYWQSLGCDLHILCLADAPGDFAETLAAAGWEIHLTGSQRGSLSLAKALRSALTRIQPDILHIHPEAYGPLPYIVGRMLGIPMARTIHNRFGFNGILCLRKICERWLARALGVRFIAIGETVSDNERQRFHNPCLLLWNWIDTAKFRPPSPEERRAARIKFNLPEDKFVMVSVGNGSDVKNYQSIIQALAHLANPRLLYCQVGHPHPAGTDETHVRHLKIEEQVRFCGPSHEVLQWLWAADLFVMPSLYEGFGLAAVEALAAGCRCIFADCPGLRDFKPLGLDASWVEPNATAFTAAIREATETPFTGDPQIETANKAREIFASEIRAQAYLDLWQELGANESHH